MYVDYIHNQLDINVQCGRHICLGAYVNNVKCMHTSAPVHLSDYN